MQSCWNIYRAIVGYAETRGWSRYNNKNKSHKDRLNKPRKEMLLLTLILDASSASRKKILTHPLIAIFLFLKWRQVRIVFWATIICNVMTFLTHFCTDGREMIVHWHLYCLPEHTGATFTPVQFIYTRRLPCQLSLQAKIDRTGCCEGCQTAWFTHSG